MKKTVVVGGGVVGILAAILEAQKGHKVYLIEKDRKIGGLLGSFEINGIWYDYGTHVPAEFQIKELNEILYGAGDRKTNFEELPFLRSENFFDGVWNTQSPLPNIHSFSKERIEAIRNQMLETKFNIEELSLGKYLSDNFGPIVKEDVYDKILSKLQGTTSDGLHKEILRTFGIQRVIAFSEEKTRELKKIPKYDNIIGFHSYEEGSPSAKYYYPKHGTGIGAWISLLTEKMKALGVEVLLGQNIQSVDFDNGYVRKIYLDDRVIEMDLLVWTVPIGILENLLGLQNGPSGKLEFRTTTLVNVNYEKPLKKEKPQYLLCWDPNYLSYRITLYPNIFKETKHNGNNLTVEILGDQTFKDRGEELQEIIKKEMYQLGIVDESNKVVDINSMYLGPTFPVMTPSFFETAKVKNERMKEILKNGKLLGRGSGKSFFISDTIKECFRELNGK